MSFLKMGGNKRQQKMDVIGLLKEWFVMSKLFEESNGSVLSSHSLLLAQHLTNTDHSIIIDSCGREKREESQILS